MSEEMEVVLDRREVSIKTKLAGESRRLVMRELDGPGREGFIEFMQERLKINPDGKTGTVTKVVGIQAKLLGMCLFDEEDNLIPEDEIKAWAGSAQEVLFEKAMKLSALDKRAEERAKNDSPGSESSGTSSPES